MIGTIDSDFLTQQIRASGKPFEHSHEHLNNANKLLFRRDNSLGSNEPTHRQHVNTCRALQCRTAAISKNLARSALENLPLLSAILSGMLVDARSSWSFAEAFTVTSFRRSPAQP